MPQDDTPAAGRKVGIYKILIFSIFSVISVLFAFTSGYAMIYRITSLIVSYISVIGVMAWLGYHLLLHKKDTYSTAPLLLFLGLYTLHRWYIALLIIVLLIASKHLEFRFINDTPGKRVHSIRTEILFAGIFFFLADLMREYSVWHHFDFRLLPCLALIAGITGYYLSGRESGLPKH